MDQLILWPTNPRETGKTVLLCPSFWKEFVVSINLETLLEML